MTTSPGTADSLVERVADLAQRSGIRVGVAESLTGGLLSSRLAGGPEAAQWFRGSVVAYAPEVKFGVLGVERGPVNTAACACQMARGAVRVLGAEVALAATGVGGPGPDEGVPAGTVFLACADWSGEVISREHHFGGSPSAVLEAAVEAGLELLVSALDAGPPGLAPWRDCHREPVAAAGSSGMNPRPAGTAAGTRASDDTSEQEERT